MNNALTVERFDAREWPQDMLDELFAEGFPKFILADLEVKPLIGPVRDAFGALEIALVGQADIPVACGWGVPIRWNGELEDLPSGYTDSLRRAVDLHVQGGEPDTLVICAGVVRPDHKGRDTARRLIYALCDLAPTHGWPRVIAPLRPTLKHRYPLTDIDEYVTWTRTDGLPYDPWVRLHVRLGATVLMTAPQSQTMTGTVSDWEGWTGLGLPASGTYVIPDGLSTLHVDREQDNGTYVEPGIWVRHR